MKSVQQHFFQWTVVALLLVQLPACGFHLRGSLGEEKTSKVYLSSTSETSELRSSINRYLQESHRLAVDETAAEVQLHLLAGKWQKRIASVGEDGVASEYILSYSVRYNFENAEKKLVDQTVSAQQDYSFNRAQLLGVDSEENQIKARLLQQITNQFIRLINM